MPGDRLAERRRGQGPRWNPASTPSWRMRSLPRSTAGSATADPDRQPRPSSACPATAAPLRIPRLRSSDERDSLRRASTREPARSWWDLRYTAGRPHAVDLRGLEVLRRDAADEVDVLAVGRPGRPVHVHAARDGHNGAGVVAAVIRHRQTVARRSAWRYVDEFLSVGRPPRANPSVDQLTGRSSERCTYDVRRKLRDCGALRTGRKDNFRSVRGDVEPSDI